MNKPRIIWSGMVRFTNFDLDGSEQVIFHDYTRVVENSFGYVIAEKNQSDAMGNYSWSRVDDSDLQIHILKETIKHLAILW